MINHLESSQITPDNKILIIIYQYYPLITPRAFRWLAIGRELIQQGYHVDVVCCAFHNLPQFELIDGINIHRVKPWFFKSIYRKNIASINNTSPSEPKFLLEKKSNHNSDNQNSQKYKKPGFLNSILSVFISIFSTIYHFFWWPDFGMFWIPPALQQSKKLIRQKTYRRVFSVSWPVSAHVVGFLLSKRLKKDEIPLIIDVGDPFSLNEYTSSNNKTLYKFVNQSFEKGLFKKATGVVVTNQSIRELYIEKFLLSEKKIKVIPPLYDSSISKDQPNLLQKRNNQNIKCLYIGSFRKGNRTPEVLFKLFTDLLIQHDRENIELHLLGDNNEYEQEIQEFKEKFKDHVFIHGLVPHETAIAATIHADVLLNIGNMSSYQLPSKLVDYIYAGKPVINIQLIEQDSSYFFLKDYPLLTNLDFCHLTYEANLKKFNSFLDQIPEKLSECTINKIIEEFSANHVTDAYLMDWWQ